MSLFTENKITLVHEAAKEANNMFKRHKGGTLTLTRYLGSTVEVSFQIDPDKDKFAVATEVFRELNYVTGSNHIFDTLEEAKGAVFNTIMKLRGGQ